MMRVTRVMPTMLVALAALTLGATAPLQRTSTVARGMTHSPLRRSALAMSSAAVKSAADRTGSVLVHDAADDLYTSREIFQQLYSHGNWAKIACVTPSVTQAKKMLLSREARYSGLIDILDLIEAPTLGAAAEASAYDTWVIVNTDGSKLSAQLEAAKAAGVTRLMLTLCATTLDGSVTDMVSVETKLKESGITYTLIRTGTLSKEAEGNPLMIDAIDAASCSPLSRVDAYRVAMESLTIDGAFNRVFSLCPAVKEGKSMAVYKEMRFAGADRRQEVVALLGGAVEERAKEMDLADIKAAEKKDAKAAEVAARNGSATSSAEEIAAAFQRAEERAVRMAAEQKIADEALAELREERAVTQDAITARIAQIARQKAGGSPSGIMDPEDDPRGPRPIRGPGSPGAPKAEGRDGGPGGAPPAPETPGGTPEGTPGAPTDPAGGGDADGGGKGDEPPLAPV
mmetsp:Transcript_3385/g.8445  ORF Transcript_3385/g.8445 Transcript_3385/m.8445 type:complete len:457 (+) Transcript_3385:3-1373(+)